MNIIKETYTEYEKIIIASKIKDISKERIKEEYRELKTIGANADKKSERCRVGNNIVDHFSFVKRLETKGKYDVNYFEFITNIEDFEKKKFIKNMLNYYEREKNKKNTKNRFIVLKEIYNICISAINIIRPLVYMEIYTKYNRPNLPNCILDFCAGWGGAAVAACALKIPRYIGIEINHELSEPYNKLCDFLREEGSETKIEMYFEDALKIDYSKFDYDFVFTSPPYYFIQKYKNNAPYKDKKEMNDQFYIPLFRETHKHLKKGGHYILNINKEIYENVCVPLLGEAHEIFTYKKSKRQNNYNEMVYMWVRSADHAAHAAPS